MYGRSRLCGALFVIAAGIEPCAGANLDPEMRPIVTCVYDMVRLQPGILSTEVYADGRDEYVVEFTFHGKAGTILIGDFGIYRGSMADGNYMYTNESPSGQMDDSGSEELDFFGGPTLDKMVERCRLMPGFDDTFN